MVHLAGVGKTVTLSIDHADLFQALCRVLGSEGSTTPA